ncbi:4-(cytidine 5'-diphospho)-2-C-methyl-D-erythritol kinase [Pedobacter sp. HMF7647]|uniref:4-diphosphocytidyl-2-C-methyl-D-erythritol kinase n=1 Tax=Hufsiella arboris TaxID=2695275 RepID=A0A7K1YET5_9SPHI|nr:4-(cytidine 5'-diphospho)-2-C-methyl-D-erythritol kinase [Hufsiella arboris]MXV52519.1 4-(cytidine 5'-diphospho)-2-C-methyl-D-erythritol kinase [Hufsiella arboris]
MISFPNAKINIGLSVVNRRADGYHNLETVFYPINIKDALEIVEAKELLFTSSGIEIPGYANENLCLKAYELIAKDYDVPPVHIHLHKNIPIGAGLGGGSADAAFFIRLMNDKFDLNITQQSMDAYARKLGADCAFFLKNVPVFARGRGDEFAEIKLSLEKYYIVLVMPPVHVSTAEAYRGVEPAKPAKSMKELIELPVKQWQETVRNDFEKSVFTNHPKIRGVKAALYEAGAVYASMSGSGSSVYGIFSNQIKLPLLEIDNVVYYGV